MSVELEEATRSPGTQTTNSFESPCGFWALEKHSVLWTSKPSLERPLCLCLSLWQHSQCFTIKYNVNCQVFFFFFNLTEEAAFFTWFLRFLQHSSFSRVIRWWGLWLHLWVDPTHGLELISFGQVTKTLELGAKDCMLPQTSSSKISPYSKVSRFAVTRFQPWCSAWSPSRSKDLLDWRLKSLKYDSR